MKWLRDSDGDLDLFALMILCGSMVLIALIVCATINPKILQ